MAKRGEPKKLVIIEIILIILVIFGLAFLIYINYNTKKIIVEQSSLIIEQKVKIQGLETKISELKDKETEILSKLNILEAKSDISLEEKQCELSGLSIPKAEFFDGKTIFKVENSNNLGIENLKLKMYLGDKTIVEEDLGNMDAFESKEFTISSEKPDELIIIPSILINGEKKLCNKQVRSSVYEVVDINGEFNFTSTLVVNGESKDINLIAEFIQTGTDISGTASARKQDGSMGQPFDIEGNVNNRIINLNAKNVELPAGSINGIDADLIIEISLEGVVENNNKIEGADMGDVTLKVKDFPAPGVTVSVEGVFIAERI